MYLDHRFPQAVARSSSTRAMQPAPSLLTELERAAIAIGLADCHLLGWDGFAYRTPLWRDTIGRVWRALGVRRVRPLADERLELLRIYTCMRRRKHPAETDVAARIAAAGMSDLALLEASNRIDGEPGLG